MTKKIKLFFDNLKYFKTYLNFMKTESNLMKKFECLCFFGAYNRRHKRPWVFITCWVYNNPHPPTHPPILTHPKCRHTRKYYTQVDMTKMCQQLLEEFKMNSNLVDSLKFLFFFKYMKKKPKIELTPLNMANIIIKKIHLWFAG